MPEFIVELHGEVRELYQVTAETAEEAAQNWFHGELYLTEVSGAEVYSVEQDSDAD